MDKKNLLVAAFILILLISAVAGAILVNLSVANFFPPEAPTGIQITSDGDVIGTDKIQRDGEVYTLTGDIQDSIVVSRDNVVIDGSGYNLIGYGNSTGVFLQDVNGVTVKRLNITSFNVGIAITWSWDRNCRNNTISGNIFSNNSVGIVLSMFTDGNIITGNTIENGECGISIHYSTGNTLRNNHISDNKYNLWVDCELNELTSGFVNDIDESNTVDGKPIVYWVNQRDKIVPSNAGYVALVSCKNITVQGVNITNNGQGVLMVATNYSSIIGNRLTNNNYGIVFLGYYGPSVYNEITANVIAENENGIRIWGDWLERDTVSHTLTFHHNSLINNTVQVTSYSYGGIWDDGSEGNYWSNYNGTDTNGDGIGDSPYVVIESYSYDWDPSIVKGSTDIDHYPLMYPWGPPFLFMVCPENKTYPTSSVPLNFTVSGPNSWIGYSLNGNENVTITGNTTLSNLSAGSYSLTIYAADMFGNIGASETVFFSVEVPFPTTLVIAASGASMAIAGVGLFMYFKKRKPKAEIINR
jgi:parallel beta-helix repeat protein